MAMNTAGQFRKKPVVIDAFPWQGRWNDLDRWLISLGYVAHDDEPAMWVNDDASVGILTLEGEMRCDVGDWIIRGVKGEFYPCKPDVFEASYEGLDADCGIVYGIEPGVYDARSKRLAEHLADRYLWVLQKRED